MCGFAALPYAPAALEFRRAGVPDVLSTGDAAVMELGTIHARHGAQLVGPYSRFGWSHPGPAFFYLAVPAYELFQERSASLRVFAFAIDLAAAAAIVGLALRLRGPLFAATAGSLLAVYELVCLPFLVANEWNPIVPILPLAAFTFLIATYARGSIRVTPVAAFLGSAIVQTHIGFAPAVVVSSILGSMLRRASAPVRAIPARERYVTAAVLAICWALPLYESLTHRPGNLQQIARFFVPKHWAEHSWQETAASVSGQMALMPWGIARLFCECATPSSAVAIVVAAGQAITSVAMVIASRRREDKALAILAALVLGQIAAALFAVRAIRGPILPYLTAWISTIGLVWAVAAIDWLRTAARRTFERPVNVVAAIASAAILALAVRGPVPRSAVVPPRDPSAEELAQRVEAHLRAHTRTPPPLVRIASPDAWPLAVAVVLHLRKRGVPVYVEQEWLPIVGDEFAAIVEPETELIFEDDRVQGAPPTSEPVAAAGGVRVTIQPARAAETSSGSSRPRT